MSDQVEDVAGDAEDVSADAPSANESTIPPVEHAAPSDAPTPGVETRGLTKVYGDKVALDSLDLTIPKGHIFGYIGPNGAGKTTTIRILSGLLDATSGRAKVHGIDVRRHPRKIKELVGYMPDAFGVYDNMTLQEYLDFFGAAYRIPRKKRRSIIDDVLALNRPRAEARRASVGFSPRASGSERASLRRCSTIHRC